MGKNHASQYANFGSLPASDCSLLAGDCSMAMCNLNIISSFMREWYLFRREQVFYLQILINITKAPNIYF